LKIIPRPDALAAPYWSAGVEGRLLIQRCAACEQLHHPPVVSCPYCHGADLTWAQLSGRGTVYTYTVVYHSVHPVSADSLPYILVLVQLEEGPRILTNLRDAEPGEVRIGMRVQVIFENLGEGIAIPQFRPERSPVAPA
jgi:uncharacterized OB-fold protein